MKNNAAFFKKLVKELNAPLPLSSVGKWKFILINYFLSESKSLGPVYFDLTVCLVNLSALLPQPAWLRAALPFTPAHPLHPMKPVAPGQPYCAHFDSERHQKCKALMHVSFRQLILPITGLELLSSPCH